ncbi:MAG TPA: crosslink repair DNA glycosylase YcaQ family protein [Bryobacteraceae bacterium]|nr:crosslink repair DNA glycosylase YcaQ family protein [Bryobacteraceae bacterium]
MDLKKLRAWWAHVQGLDGALLGKKPAEVLTRSGWARSVGGTAPYLTLFARAGTSREAADRAVADLEIHELPAARGCTYVVPAADFALALRVGEAFGDAEMKVAAKLGVTEKEVGKLCEAVQKALEQGALGPDEIRDRVGKAARSLGEEGKKKGLSSTLPLALGKLQSAGEIRRVSLNGRLDQQRYRYTLWRPNPVAAFRLSPEETSTELARRYFSWIGPATLADFQEFAGLGVKAAKAAVEPLKLEPLETGDDRMSTPAIRAKLEAFQAPKEARYVLVSSLDGVSLLRRDRNTLIDEAIPPTNQFTPAIFDHGRLVGLWEYDPATESIVWMAFIKKNKDLEAAVRQTEEYVRAQLGDVRVSALDSPKSRAPRIEALRKAAAG